MADWPLKEKGDTNSSVILVPQQKLSTTELNFGLQMIYYLTSSSSSSWMDRWTNRSLMAANYKLPIHSHTLDSHKERKEAKWTVGKSASNLYFMLIVERLLSFFSADKSLSLVRFHFFLLFVDNSQW